MLNILYRNFWIFNSDTLESHIIAGNPAERITENIRMHNALTL